MATNAKIAKERNYSNSRGLAIVWNNVVPLVRRRAGDKRDDRFGFAHVKDLMGHTRLDINEIAGLIFEHLLQAGPELVPDFSFENIENQFEPDMNMRVRDASRRDRRDIRRELRRPDVLRRHSLLIMNPIPIAARPAAANGKDAVMIFHGAQLDVVFHVKGGVPT